MTNILAVIVTFNRPLTLHKCLSSLVDQHENLSVHVIVNSQDRDTLDVIESFNDKFSAITHQGFDNVGPAGGFYYGLEFFLKGAFSFAWLMDDDIIVESGCLHELLVSALNSPYVFPQVLKNNGEEVLSFGWWGLLLQRDLVVKVGLPLKELFYWIEDTEYLQYRIPLVNGAGPFRNRSAVVRHLHFRSNHFPSWYYYYATRNNLYYRTRVVALNWNRFKRTVIIYLKFSHSIIFHEPRKMTKFYMMILGTYHGSIGRLGKIVDPKKYL